MNALCPKCNTTNPSTNLNCSKCGEFIHYVFKCSSCQNDSETGCKISYDICVNSNLYKAKEEI